MLNLIAELKRELGFAAMIVTHNLAMIRHVSDRLAIMYLGRLVETGPTQAVFAAPLHPYTATLIAVGAGARSAPAARQTWPSRGEIPSVFRRPSGCEFHTRCPIARDRCRIEAPAYRAHVAGDRMVRCHFPLETGGQEREAFQRASANHRGNDMIRWNTDRRSFLKAAGALGAAADDDGRASPGRPTATRCASAWMATCRCSTPPS